MRIALIRKKTVKRLLVFLVLLILFSTFGYLYLIGILQLNNPSKKKYPVRGVDVSHYQGDIDWDTLAGQGIDFAFIKATEGSSHVDKNFAKNWEKASQADIVIGAYHFFSLESSGLTQAENFIKTVPKAQGTLPPAVDVELYGAFSKNPPDAATVRLELERFINAIEAHYGKKVVIYTTQTVYRLYIENYFQDNPLWIRNVYSRPILSDDREWTFWQYSDRGRLNGYDGVERFIDLNVFNGTREEFAYFCR
ncbi:MAG: glycoside hydrolase family 25 protein [Clostridiaceae bacterium]|jgi:lysozyme|nr:glycoside hydrolase family 25 protein [Clostridiaceae bacterium]